MKKIGKIILIIGILLIIIGLLYFILYRNKTDYSKIKENKSLEIIDFKIDKLYRTCIISFYISRSDLIEVDFNNYDIYLLDNSNNLIYTIKGDTFGEGGFESNKYIFNMSKEINYDVSSAVKAEISFKGNPYKYKKDLTATLKEMPIEK